MVRQAEQKIATILKTTATETTNNKKFRRQNRTDARGKSTTIKNLVMRFGMLF